MKQKTVMVLAGGTGGHVFPALAVAEVWRQQGLNVEWIGTAHGIENRVVPPQGIVLHRLAVRGLRGRSKLSLLLGLVPVFKAWWNALQLMRRVDVVLALGMGGYVTGPAGIAARMVGKPLVLHEQNAVAGLSNRWLAPWATLVLTGFPGVFKDRPQQRTVGNPVRASLQQRPAAPLRKENTIALLVLGGSQGADALNRRLPLILREFATELQGVELQIRHQCGEKHLSSTQAAYQVFNAQVEVVAFIDDMAQAYAAADLVICRAGALTVAELAAAGKASILVPFPFAVDDHQTRNAEYLVQAGAAFLCPQEEMEQRLPQYLAQLCVAEFRQVMAERAYALAMPQAARVIAQLCLELI